MPVTLIHPAGVNQVEIHHQIAVAEGTRTVHMAGQVSWDAAGTLVGRGDLAAQAEQAFLNVAAALAGAGATVDDLVSFTAYIVGLNPETTGAVVTGRERAAAKLGVSLQKPGTYIGVASLFDPDYLIEVNAIAVLP